MRSILFVALLGLSTPGLAAAETVTGPAERSPANVRVTLPADALLTVDGRATQSTSAERLFVTPPLEAGKRYRYTFSARVLRAGKAVTVEQDVFVQAGRETLVAVDVPADTPASPPSRGGTASSFGPGAETRAYYAYYYGAPEPPAPPRAGLYPAPPPGSGGRGPDEGRSPLQGYTPPHWGIDPSDPFYHSQP